MEHRIMYLRDSYTVVDGKLHAGQPVGCVAIKLHRGGTSAEYQVSVLNPQDHFDRSVARQLALGRMVEAPFTVRLPKNATMHHITEAVMRDIEGYHSHPARARKAAKLWLRHNAGWY